MRVLFAGGGSGGHLYPALAIARALVRVEPRAEPFFVGARRGVERDVLPTTEFPFLLLDLHPVYRTKPWRNFRTVSSAGAAWRAVSGLLRAERVALVVATGGYASGATLARAVAARIPIVLQEQNGYPGLTTRLFSRWATEIYLGYNEAAARLHPPPGAWVGETGNPVTPPPEPRPDRGAARREWGFPALGGVVLLVVGGSQGALAINEVMAAWVGRGIRDGMYVIWATGRGAHERYAHLERERVRVVPYLAPIARAYAAADLALARAGAQTIAELCVWGLPSLLVPLPTAAADHQSANARVLAGAGAAVQMAQSEFTVERLDVELRRLTDDETVRALMAMAAAARGRPRAADDIARRIVALLARL